MRKLYWIGRIIPSVAILAAGLACGGTTDPRLGPFSGTYHLAIVGTTPIPGRIYTFQPTGEYGIMLSGSLNFLEPGRVSIITATETHSSATAPAVMATNASTYALRLVGDSAIVLQLVSVDPRIDTVASISDANGRVRWKYRGAIGLGVYEFAR